MSEQHETRIGVFYALGAFTIWGLFPLYFKATANVPPLQVLAHRIVWSIPFTALLIAVKHDWHALIAAVSQKKVLYTLIGSSMLIGINWLLFIYAIVSGQVLQTSLGYFMTPLFNVALGVIFLKEKLRRAQLMAVILAAAGTLNMSLFYEKTPWISLVLGISFSFYGLLRKTVKIESVNGLFVETMILFPFCAAYLIYVGVQGTGAFGTINMGTTVLLALAGVITALPLVWFTSGARRLQYATVGIFQYIAPSVHFMLAVFLYREKFTVIHLITFICIWTAIGVFMTDTVLGQRRMKKVFTRA